MKKYILIISAIISIGLTSYFSLLPLNGVSQADISNIYSTPITPAGFTFSIWSLIYASWLGLWIYALTGKLKTKKALRYKLTAAQLISATWLIPWHYQYILISAIVIFTILVILWNIMNQHKLKSKVFEYIVALFMWWIAIASLVNINIVLIAYDLYTYPQLFSGLSLLLWALFSWYWIYKKSSYIPLLVFIWAIIWIIVK